MGVIVRKEFDKDTELSNRITADLRNRDRSGYEDKTDFTESEYTKDLKKTSKFGWVWFVLIGLAVLSLVLISVI